MSIFNNFSPVLQVREEVWRRREEELMEQEERFMFDRTRRMDEPYDYMDWCSRYPPHRGPPLRPHHPSMGPPPHPMMGPRHPFMHQGPPMVSATFLLAISESCFGSGCWMHYANNYIEIRFTRFPKYFVNILFLYLCTDASARHQ